jgi:hypothetical protein
MDLRGELHYSLNLKLLRTRSSFRTLSGLSSRTSRRSLSFWPQVVRQGKQELVAAAKQGIERTERLTGSANIRGVCNLQSPVFAAHLIAIRLGLLLTYALQEMQYHELAWTA